MAGEIGVTAETNGGSAAFVGPPDSSIDTKLKLPADTGSAGKVLAVKSDNHSSTNAELEWAAAGVLIKKSYYEIVRSAPAGNAWPMDDTSPQITEGDEIFSQSYTPSTANCDLYINTWFHAGESSNVSNAVHAGLFISGTNDALQVGSCPAEYYGNANRQINGKIIFIYKMASWGTTAKTFSIRTSGCNAVNYHYIGGLATQQFSAGSSKTGFIIEEVST